MPRNESIATPQERGYLGSAFRLTLDLIDQKGWRDAIRAEAPPDTARMMEAPPGPLSWIPAARLEDLEELVARHGGRDAAFELGLLAARNLGGSIVKPVIKFAVMLFGSTPDALFANLDKLYSMVTRGLHFVWRSEGRKDGVVEAQFDGGGVRRSLFEVTRGNLQYVLEVCGTSGEVGAPQIVRHDERGAVVQFRIRWA
jgi:hypothetical protein